jgi:hypothetical protein
MEGDESGRVGDWGTKLGNCLTTEEREEVTRCYETKSDDLLRAVSSTLYITLYDVRIYSLTSICR